MIRNVIISKIAAKKLSKLFDYLTENWSVKVKDDFIKKLDRSIEIMGNHPESFPQSYLKPGLHKCVVTTQATLYFRFTLTNIKIITLFDNRQHPSKLKKELR